MHAGGLVGFSDKTADGQVNTIENCTVSVNFIDPEDAWYAFNNLTFGGYKGGVVAHALNSSLTIRNTVWDGTVSNILHYNSLKPLKDNYAGGLIGWCDSGANLTVENCIAMGAYTDPEAKNFHPVALKSKDSTVTYSETNCFYTTDPTLTDSTIIAGSGQKPYIISEGEGVAIKSYGTPVNTPGANGVASYSTGVAYNRKFYTSAGAEVTMNVASSTPGYATKSVTVNGTELARNADGTYTFTMPAADVTVNAEFIPDTAHFSQNGDTYTIHDATGWDVFCNCLQDDAYNCFAGKTVQISDKFSGTVTRDAGTLEKPFKGTFDGCGQTVNVSITDTTNQGTALFRAFGVGAVIKNLTVTGSLTGTTHAAGLVGFSVKLADGKTNTIENCIVSADVVNPHDLTTSQYLQIGGVVGQGSNSSLAIRNTVWNGSMSNKGHYAGGFMGWCENDAKLTLENCIAAGTYKGTASNGSTLLQSKIQITKLPAPKATATIADGITDNADGTHSFTVPAEDVTVSPVFTYTLDDAGTLTIGGKGNMENFTPSAPAPWSKYQSKVKAVVIGESVTSVGDYAFAGCTSLTSVKISSGVTRIGVDAFAGCTSLADVYCEANPANLTRDESRVDDFIYSEEPYVAYATFFHVPTYYYSNFSKLFGPRSEQPANVTFAGDIGGDGVFKITPKYSYQEIIGEFGRESYDLNDFFDVQYGSASSKNHIWEAKNRPKAGIYFDADNLVHFTRNGTFQVRVADPRNPRSYSYWIDIEAIVQAGDSDAPELPEAVIAADSAVDADENTTFVIEGSYTGLVGAASDAIEGEPSATYNNWMEDDAEVNTHGRLLSETSYFVILK